MFKSCIKFFFILAVTHSVFSLDKLLQANDAFKVNFEPKQNLLVFSVKIASGYYIYDNIKIYGSDNLNVKLISSSKPNLNKNYDANYSDFDTEYIYEDTANFTVEINKFIPNSQVTFEFSGCAKDRFCYPMQQLKYNIPSFSAESNITQQEKLINQDFASSNLKSVLDINKVLDSDKPVAFWYFLLIGVFLAFTPCMFPMYPILSGVIVNFVKKKSYSVILLSVLFILGMALTYAALGAAVAFIGMHYQAFFQQPLFLIASCLIFIALALSMLDFYELNLPYRFRNYINECMANSAPSGLLAVFLLGAMTGLIASPCTTAPIAGTLIYISQFGDLLYGFFALFFLGLGIGLPVMFIAVVGSSFLPKSGAWMSLFKNVFGFLFLALAIYMLDRLLNPAVIFVLYSILFISASCFFYIKRKTLPKSKHKTYLLIISLISLLIVSFLYNYYNLFAQKEIKAYFSANQSKPDFLVVYSLEHLQDAIEDITAKQNKGVILDFMTDYCTSCKDLYVNTLSNSEVSNYMKDLGVILIQVNLTKSDASAMSINKKYNIKGVPLLVFLNNKGEELKGSRQYGLVDKNHFIEHLRELYSY